MRPSRSRLKVYIIDEVHMLTKEAFNALLKTLEEPPEHVNRLLGIAPATRVAELAERLADRDAASGLALLDAAVRSGADPGQVLDQLMGYYRDALAAAVGAPAEQMLTALPAQYDGAKALGQRLGVHTLLAAMQVLDQTASRMRVSVHERTLADMAVVRLATLEDLDGLAQAVADLRAGGAPSPPPAPKKNTERPVAPPSPPVTAKPASGGAPAPAPVSAMVEELAALQQSAIDAAPGPGAPRRASRRQQQAEVAQNPFVARAMDLFGVEPDKMRYTPPGGSPSSGVRSPE